MTFDYCWLGIAFTKIEFVDGYKIVRKTWGFGDAPRNEIITKSEAGSETDKHGSRILIRMEAFWFYE